MNYQLRITLKKFVAVLLLVSVSTFAGEAALLEGKSRAAVSEQLEHGQSSVVFDITMTAYPASADSNPAYQLLNAPITTDKIRFVSNDNVAHVTEIRLFEPGMPNYPPVLGGDAQGLSVPNHALGADAAASSFYDNSRPAKAAVDGVVSFESRWASAGKPPHTLVIDMKKKHTIGCIQMVSGYLSGSEWKGVAGDFYFEYFDNGVWKRIEGSGRRTDTELSSLAVTLKDHRGDEYLLIGRSFAKNWAVGKRAAGKVEILKELSAPQLSLYESQRHRLELMIVRDKVMLILDGRAAIDFEHRFEGKVSIGLESLSKDVVISVDDIKVSQRPAESCAVLKDVRIDCMHGESPLFAFNPLVNIYQVQLPAADIQKVRIEVLKAFESQTVKIDGKAADRAVLDFSDRSKKDVCIDVTSADKLQTNRYFVEILPVPPSDEFELAFSDDFDGEVLDTVRWRHRTGTRWESIQRPENVQIKDGTLVIELDVDDKGSQYTGGIISNEPLGYGYYETKAKLWKGKGWHSAFWQMQSGGVVVNEIDCFESVSPSSFSSNLHYYKPRHILGAQNHSADVASDFNVYAWEWMPDRVRFYFNGTLIRDAAYPGPHKPQNVWLTCVAHPDATTQDLPGTVEFEYFRYYRKKYMADITPASIVVDNETAGYSETGDWADGKYPVSYSGDFKTRVSQSALSGSMWRPFIGTAGLYDVYVWNPYVFADKNVPQYSYTINYRGGSKDISFCPMYEGQKWVQLGRFDFDSGTDGYVRMNVIAGISNRADAVMLTPVLD